jgi:hypothetical protein
LYFAAAPMTGAPIAAFAAPPNLTRTDMSVILAKGVTPAGTGKAGPNQDAV